jgi:mRNA-degrading endonuclease RelE of RelBE toxin-antitoxin system
MTLNKSPLVEISLTNEFKKRVRILSKKYRQIQTDLQPIFEQLQEGNFLGDQIPGINATVMKVRVRNSDSQKGKSGGYRLIYWISSPKLIVLLDLYSKSEQEDLEVENIRQIIQGFSHQ